MWLIRLNCLTITAALACGMHGPCPKAMAQNSAQMEQLDSMSVKFLEAAASNDVATLKAAIARGIPVDTADARGRTALLLATYANSIDTAGYLISKGADVNAKDQIGDSPYLYAGAEGRLEILKMTVEAGADLSSVNRYGGTSLIPAAHHGHFDVVRYLLTTDIDIDHVNNLGWTALLEAVILGDGSPVYQDIVRLLLEGGADTLITDKDGVTPLQHAKSRDYWEIAAMLARPDVD